MRYLVDKHGLDKQPRANIPVYIDMAPFNNLKCSKPGKSKSIWDFNRLFYVYTMPLSFSLSIRNRQCWVFSLGICRYLSSRILRTFQEGGFFRGNLIALQRWIMKTRFQAERLERKSLKSSWLSWEKEHDSSKKPLMCFQCFKKHSNYNRAKWHFNITHMIDCKCKICDLPVLCEMHPW